MHVTSWDICVSGYERLRTQTEILLPVFVANNANAELIRSALHDEITCCMRRDGDEAALDAAVDSWWLSASNSVLRTCRALDDMPEDEDCEGCCLYVYVETGDDRPVWDC